MLFGLGFDTATEVALLVIAGSAGAAGLPWYAILCLPILFAAGMSLLDSIDGSFMNFAYDWAFSRPVRKVFYNITITGLSVAVALVIGTIELGGLIAQHLNLSGPFWNWFENIDINFLGFLIVGMFVATWRSRCRSGTSGTSKSAGALISKKAALAQPASRPTARSGRFGPAAWRAPAPTAGARQRFPPSEGAGCVRMDGP